MITVLIPIALLLAIVLIKKIPYIGGNVNIALLVASLAALLINGMYNPISWITAWISGIDRIAWVMALALLGSIYAETQVRIGTMETVLESLRAAFGKSPKGLIICIMISLAIAGALLGDSIAAAAVIGVLIVPILADLDMKPEAISATLIMGAGVGSIMPPISQAYFLAIGLVGADRDAVISRGYFWTALALTFVTVYAILAFVRVKRLPEDLMPKETAWQIIKRNWKTLIPLSILIIIIVLLNGFKINLMSFMNPAFVYIDKVPILSGLDFDVTKAILLVTVISFVCYKVVREHAGDVLKTAWNNVKSCTLIQLCAGCMIGSFYASGLLETVKNFAMSLNQHVLKFGGALAMLLIGMLTGSQTTTQTTILSFFGPAVIATGVDPVNAALAGAHLATAGEGFPPVCLATFVVAGLVGGILGKKVNPLGSMFRSLPYCLYFLFTGILLLYI